MPFTEFYTDFTNGSNVNAGSTTSGTATYTATNGGWNSGTGVFTPTSGDPSATVSVGDFASVYLDAATLAVFVGRVTAVSSTTITVSTTAKSGTAPTTGGSGLTCKVGGCWKGPNAAIGFPFNFAAAAMTDSSANPCRVNFKNNAIYSITAAMTQTLLGNLAFQGYSATAGDGGRAIIDGGTSGSSYVLLTISGLIGLTRDLIFQNNGATGSADGVSVTGTRQMMSGCVFNSIRGSGLAFSGSASTILSEIEAYACNQSNTSGKGGLDLAGSAVMYGTRLIAHDNAGNNSFGIRLGSAFSILDDVIVETNGGAGIVLSSVNGVYVLNNVDAYSNGGSGVLANSIGNISLQIENSNLVKNGAYGIDVSAISSLSNVLLRNNGYGAGTQANTSGNIISGINLVSENAVTYASNVTPWVDPANGDFRINLAAAKNTGRGAFTQTASSYAGAIGYPDIGAAQAQSAGGIMLPRPMNGGFSS